MQLITVLRTAPIGGDSCSSSSKQVISSHPALHVNQEYDGNDDVKPQFTPIQYLRSMFPEDHRRNRYVRLSRNSNNHEEKGDYNPEAARAIRSNDIDTLRQLHEDGETFEGCNRNGETLLHLACRRSDIEIISFLVVEAGVNVDVRDSLGRTVLHDVCWRPRPSFHILELFMKVIDPSLLIAEDMRGHTPFDYTRRSDYAAWNQYLSQKRESIELRIALSITA